MDGICILYLAYITCYKKYSLQNSIPFIIFYHLKYLVSHEIPMGIIQFLNQVFYKIPGVFYAVLESNEKDKPNKIQSRMVNVRLYKNISKIYR